GNAVGGPLVDNSGVDISGDVVLSIPFPYGEATTYVISITAESGTDAGATFSVTVLVDTVDPSATIEFPNEADSLTAAFDASQDAGFQPVITVNTVGVADGTVVDVKNGNTVVGTCTVQSNVCSGELTLDDGSFALTVTVTDAAGNTATSAVRNFSVDGTRP